MFLVNTKLKHLSNVTLCQDILFAFHNHTAAAIYHLSLTVGFPQQSFPLLQFSLSIYFPSRGYPAHYVPSPAGFPGSYRGKTVGKFHAGFYSRHHGSGGDSSIIRPVHSLPYNTILQLDANAGQAAFQLSLLSLQNLQHFSKPGMTRIVTDDKTTNFY